MAIPNIERGLLNDIVLLRYIMVSITTYFRTILNDFVDNRFLWLSLGDELKCFETKMIPFCKRVPFLLSYCYFY